MTKHYRDKDGRYLGGFDGATGKVPEGAIEVAAPPERGDYIWTEAGGWAPDATLLASIKIDAAAQVDAEAGRARRQWITAAEGQELVYEAKRHETVAWESDTGAPRYLDRYPFMVARAARLNRVRRDQVTIPMVQAVATEWRGRIDAWLQAGLDIEDIREHAKEGIDAAADVAAIRAVLSELNWPAPA